ncbi:MAG: hypothetical protein WCP08_12790 [Prolixibacteraceae bacterium]
MKQVLIFLAITLLLGLSDSLAQNHFYVNSQIGSDANAGSLKSPWKTLKNVSGHSFFPGDIIHFACGSSFYGCVEVNCSGAEGLPIVFTNYGKGNVPKFNNSNFDNHCGRSFQVEGSHIMIGNLFFYDTPTPTPEKPPVDLRVSQQHKNVPNMGAVFIGKNASNVVVENCEFSNALIGIRVRGSHSIVRHNYLHDAAKLTEQWGAIAIVIVGPFNEVAYNQIENYGFYGGNFGMDGAAIELDAEDHDYNANDTYIHHNVSINTKGGFCEITGNADNVTLAYNYSDDIDKFVGTVGVKNLKVINNTIIRMRNPDLKQMVFWQLDQFGKKRKSEYYLENNLIYINRNVRIYDTLDRSWGIKQQPRKNNLYFSPDTTITSVLGLDLNPSEVVCDPEFADFKSKIYKSRISSVALSRGIGAFTKSLPVWNAGIIKK